MQRAQSFLTTLIVALSIMVPISRVPATAQEATPAVMYACDGASTPTATTHDMPMVATPAAGIDHAAMEFDQMYIDMMIPHHESIIAMAQAALPRLQDERLREIAQAVIEEQGAEIAQLREYRESWYGDPNPVPFMDESMIEAMAQMMPGVGDMEAMGALMDAEALVAAFCMAENADLAFIDLTVPHHQMAITASEAALEQATHPEIRAVAQQVIDAQQREIAQLAEIRQDLAGTATPTA